MIPVTALLDVGMRVLDRFVPDPQAKQAAQAELMRLHSEGRLAELNADNIENQELTKRQQADMASDSWLSKNIRPMTLIFILIVYTVFALMSAYGYDANESYVTLLGQWGMLIMSFYFGGRTLEKIMMMRQDTQRYAAKSSTKDHS